MSLLHRFDRFLFQRSRQRILHGIAVRTLWLSGRDAEAAFEKVAAALELIQKYSPRDFTRLRCLVKGIWVGGCIENLGEWYSALGLVNLQLK
ncbi:MAG TPA: hypothetical protein VK689_00345, partial [Armatimonadota bacterium]|nr:hypothetical protein [Armatimonadota bacterium]